MSSVPTAGAAKARGRVPLFTAEAWAPLKSELFRGLWIATTIAQIGTWVREAAGPTLMEILTHDRPDHAIMVGRVLVFSSLPICLFSVLAGVAADIFDRRWVLIVTQVFMIVVSAAMGLLTIFGAITPGWLLFLTFLSGTGIAAFGPALQAVLPELVPREHFSLAINMNSIALNLARAVGPALFVLVVHFIAAGKEGTGIAFILSGASFIWVIWVLWRWKRPPERAAVHGEAIWNGIRAGFWYTVHSPANRAILLRVLTFIVPAVVLWSQVPIIATDQLHMSARMAQITALLFTFVGAGAILGVLLMPGLHGRFDIDPVVNVCTALFAIGLMLLSFAHTLWTAAPVLIFLGVTWVIIPTNFNTATQKSIPSWVKGRAISFYLTVLYGSFAIGAAMWGHVTTWTHSIHASLLIGGIAMLVLLLLAYWFPLTLNAGKDLAVAHVGPPSDDVLGARPDGNGPLGIAIRYKVPAHRAEGFRALMHDLRRTRLRNGALRWRLSNEESPEDHVVFSERVTFRSWGEYTRYHSRTTKWDLMLEGLAREYHLATDPPATVADEPRRRLPELPFKWRRSAVAGAQPTGPATLIETAVATATPEPLAAPLIAPEQSAPVHQSAVPAAPVSHWMEDRIIDGLDRVLDEMFMMFDRLAKPANSRIASRRSSRLDKNR